MRLVGRLALATGVLCLIGLALWLYAQRHVYKIDVPPGEANEQLIEVPMQRGAEHKRFARERLPVTCRIQHENGPRDILVDVMETSHTVHQLHARVRVSVPRGAKTGRRVYRADFKIGDVGGWPTARLLVNVR